MTRLLVATRSRHKLDELRQMLPPIPGLEIIDLVEGGIPEQPDEGDIEAFFTFEENALAKARHFGRLSGLPTMADDSGLCVDALAGAPGPLSKRYSRRGDLSGAELDQANNDRLLRELEDTPATRRTAHYVCVIAIVTPDGQESIHRGTVDGSILMASRGVGGFGYDPLFYVPELEATFAEVDQMQKNAISHRARALHDAIPRIREIVREGRGDADFSPAPR